MTASSFSFAAATAAFALAFAQVAVLARPVSHDPRAVEVAYGDLDLTDSSDAAALYGRLETAAREACGAATERVAAASGLVRECVARAVADAVDRVDSELLMRLHRTHEPSSARS